MRYARCALAFAAVLAVLSCSPAGDKTLTLLSEAALDGSITYVYNPDESYVLSASDESVSIGDVDNDTDYTRCVVSFDLSSLPADVDIQLAVLRVYQTVQSASGNSYAPSTTGLEDVLVDNINYTSFINDAPFLTNGQDIGTLSTSFSANTWHELDVTVSALDEVNQTQSGRLQFRLYHHYTNNNDLIEDTDDWVMGDSPTNQPELVITYK